MSEPSITSSSPWTIPECGFGCCCACHDEGDGESILTRKMGGAPVAVWMLLGMAMYREYRRRLSAGGEEGGRG